MIIKSVDSLSVGKIAGVLYAIFGLLYGGLMAVMIVGLGAVRPGGGGGMGPAEMGMGLGMVILVPVMFGVGGFVGGVIGGLLYNVTASIVGGIEFETESARYADDRDEDDDDKNDR